MPFIRYVIEQWRIYKHTHAHLKRTDDISTFPKLNYYNTCVNTFPMRYRFSMAGKRTVIVLTVSVLPLTEFPITVLCLKE